MLEKSSFKKILVTGGAGFIGSNLVHYLIHETGHRVINVDKLTYAGHIESLAGVMNSDRHHFIQLDICDQKGLQQVFEEHKPDGVLHLAAESHVDRSIDGSAAFMQTNIMGTHTLLEVSLAYYRQLPDDKKKPFRFLHVSTDEVYGALGKTGFFREDTPYDPRSPYSASKASSDHLVRAWFHTFGLPTMITNCSNNYGPYQFPEKLIPVVILKALQGNPIPVYGKGDNVRDWLYVKDHAKALLQVFEEGKSGETYNIGGHTEKTNLQVVETICSILDEVEPRRDKIQYKEQITFVQDRPGHDFRYAIDAGKIEKELGWKPQENFRSGIRNTIRWYLENLNWCEEVTKNNYNLERLGTKG